MLIPSNAGQKAPLDLFFAMKENEYVRKVEIISPAQAYEEVLQGNFNMYNDLKKGDLLRIEQVELVYIVSDTPPRHIKNHYAIRSGYGTEPYASEYRLSGGVRSLNTAIGPGWERQDRTAVYLADLSVGLEHELHVIRQDSGRVEFRITYRGQGLPEDGRVTENTLCRKMVWRLFPSYTSNSFYASFLSYNSSSA